MSWIKKRRNVWRAVILILLLASIAGPWTFDVIWVPSEPPYTPCSTPFIRIDEDFCGIPMSGEWLLGFMVSGFVSEATGLVTGVNDFSESVRIFLVGLVLSLLALPFFGTLNLILRSDSSRRQVFNIVAWAPAIGIGLFIGLSSSLRQLWVLWGIWLFVALASCSLILEVLTLTMGRRSSQG